MSMVESQGKRHHEHVAQFFGNDVWRLTRNVAAYLYSSLSVGGAAIVVAGDARRTAILEQLKNRIRPTGALIDERIVLLDDDETLGEFMVEGRPDAIRFGERIGTLVHELHQRYGHLRAYGEMVGKLWRLKEYSAAAALEALWNALLERVDFDLFCGYPIDVLAEEFQLSSVRAVLSSHTRLVSALDHSFDIAMHRAMNDVLGDKSRGLRTLASGEFQNVAATLPPAERTILRLRHSLPRYADDILARARSYHRYQLAP
jgi:hypothetical protein